MASRVWSTSDDGTIIYQSLTAEYLESALQVLEKSFYIYESACIAVGITGNDEAISELNELTIRVARDGVSVIAVEKNSNRVCSVAFNKLQVKNNSEDSGYFETYAKSCKHPSSRSLVKFMADADARCDLFEYCNVDCLLEVMFLATLPEFMNRGIATKLCSLSTDIAKKLLSGVNVKQSIDGTQLKMVPAPKLVAALFTTPRSQRIGRKMGWEIAATLNYDRFFHEGKPFSSVLGEEVPYTTLEFKRL